VDHPLLAVHLGDLALTALHTAAQFTVHVGPQSMFIRVCAVEPANYVAARWQEAHQLA
jgi:hypothetical protein